MITVTIMGPTKSGKSILAQHIKFSLKSLGDSVTISDDSPHIPKPSDAESLPFIFKGTEIQIVVI